MRFFSFLLLLCFCVCLSCPAKADRLLLPDFSDIIPKKPEEIKVNFTEILDDPEFKEGQIFDRDALQAFYEARDFKTVWVGGAVFQKSKKPEQILSVLENAWRHGLNPAQYNIAVIKNLMIEDKGSDDLKLDLLLSDAVMRYGRDITGMRVPARTLGYRTQDWRQPLQGIDVLNFVAQSTSPKQALGKLAPQGTLYKSLQKELITLYETKDNPDHKSIDFQGLLQPRQRHRSVPDIRRRMGFADPVLAEEVNYYDDQLAQAVMAFQSAHGLKPDGIIGPHTLKLMNITRQDKIDQILVNLERLRWVEPEKPARYVMVNVPSARLWAVEDNQVKLEMPVVVGREKRETKIFSAMITGVRFNPTWTVPPTIKKDDYLPELQKDPYYLSDRGIELVQDGMTIDPGTIDWGAATWRQVNNMKMVQGSGSANPLGLVRILMDNPYNIYLHDTPSKSLFKLDNRALSSGCVRVEDAQALADFILTPNQGWSTERKQDILNSGRQTNISTESPLSVYILYQTIWLGDRGQLVYGHDIYQKDKNLLKALVTIGGIAYPLEEELKTAFKD